MTAAVAVLAAGWMRTVRVLVAVRPFWSVARDRKTERYDRASLTKR